MGQWRRLTRRLLVVGCGLAIVLCTQGGRALAQDTDPLLPLVDASAQRLQTAEAVAAYKWVNAIEIEDRGREQQVLDSVADDASAKRIDPAYVTKVFRSQIDATTAVQYSRFADWKFDPSTAPVTAQDLGSSRATIDTLNATIVNEIGLQWNALHGPECAGNLVHAIHAVAEARRLDPLYQRALSSATASYCG